MNTPDAAEIGAQIIISWTHILIAIASITGALATLWKLLTMRMKTDINKKADQIEVDKSFEINAVERRRLNDKIEAVKESSNDKFDIILKQFEYLREDLRLKKDKNGN